MSSRAPASLLHVTATLLLVVGILVGCGRGTTTSPPPTDEDSANQVVPVAAQAAQVGSLRATVHASGTVVPADGAEFLAVAPEPARVIDVTKNQGDPVAVGEVLVRFDLQTAVQELARQQAETARVQAQLENVRANRQRVADFVERGLVPRNDLNQADRELSDAQAAVTTTAAALKRAQDNAARGAIVAPFSGIVATRLHNPGDVALATVTDPVLRIVDPTRLEILATIPTKEAARVLPGASARVAGAVDGQIAIPLLVSSRPSGAPDALGNVRIRLGFRGPATLMVDAAVEVDIDAEERPNVVFVPLTALVGTATDQAVFIVTGDVAERRRVTVGVITEQGVEVTDGLAQGELVVVRGQGSVVQGSKLSVDLVR